MNEQINSWTLRQVYYDKNGNKIKAGDIIVHDNGDEELVHEYGDQLGIDATNPNCKFAEPCFYPLSEFDLKEWTIKEAM